MLSSTATAVEYSRLQQPRDTVEHTVNIDDDLALRYYRLQQSETGDIEFAETGYPLTGRRRGIEPLV